MKKKVQPSKLYGVSSTVSIGVTACECAILDVNCYNVGTNVLNFEVGGLFQFCSSLPL